MYAHFAPTPPAGEKQVHAVAGEATTGRAALPVDILKIPTLLHGPSYQILEIFFPARRNLLHEKTL